MEPMTRAAILAALSIALAACGDNARGVVRVNLQVEDTITKGLSIGADIENTRDYAVSYSKFILTVGDIELGQSSSDRHLKSEALYVVDLTKVDEQGVEIAKFEDVPAGQWDKFGFETPAATQGVEAIEVSSADARQMAEHGWTYWIEGTVERAEAQGGPVDFVIQTAVHTLFKECGLDGQPGLTVVENGTATGTVTIHGDHLCEVDPDFRTSA
jgi:hypothetical protein